MQRAGIFYTFHRRWSFSTPMPIRKFRIAPTPSGFLHRGNAANFLLTAHRAAEAGGVLRLRIDDLDRERLRREYLEDIFESLRWLGISWTEGPMNAAEQENRDSQRFRMPHYEALLSQLVQRGKVFACDCSRSALAARGAVEYDGFCRQKGLSLASPGVCWRVDTPADAQVTFWDAQAKKITASVAENAPYFIIRRRDGLPAYQVASLSDDLDFGITDIVRGQDLWGSTIAQLYLSQLLGGTDFDAVRFEHHPLLLDAAGGKLSKSVGAASLRAARKRGEAPPAAGDFGLG